MELNVDLKRKRAVITGGASGIGQAIAADLAARGAQVIIADINPDTLAETAASLGDAVFAVACDVSKHAEVEALAQTTVERLGGVDLVFANAGVIASGRLLGMKPQDVDWILGVNVRGLWSTLAVFGQLMAQQPEGGRICITGSEHSLGFQHAGAGIYTASKHAALGMADVLRAELPETISVSVLCPGLVATALGSAPRAASTQAPSRAAEMSKRIQARGMAATEIARQAVDGVLRGDFLIVTHPHAVRAADRRHSEISEAFAHQAPWTEESERYDVNRVMAEVAAEMRNS